MTRIADWKADLEASLSRHNLVFVHLGAAFPFSRSALEKSFAESLVVQSLVDGAAARAEAILINGVEICAAGEGYTLGQLREQVLRLLDAGHKVVLCSRLPRSRFPDVPGSSILFDAKPVGPPALETGEYYGAELSSSGVDEGTVMRRTFEELGPMVSAALDREFFEESRSGVDLLKALDEPVKNALHTSGLLTIVRDDYEWVDAEIEARVREALPDILARITVPPEVIAQVAGAIWIIERRLRIAIRARAMVVWQSKWVQELLGVDLRAQVLARASAHLYPFAQDLSDVRDPVDWLSLSELFRLRRDAELGGLGLSESMWLRLERELVPLRVRLTHSQLLLQGDLNLAKQWEKILLARLSLIGISEPFSRAVEMPLSQREIVGAIREQLSENESLVGDMAILAHRLVSLTVRFLAHTIDFPRSYTARVAPGSIVPLEADLHRDFEQFMNASEFSGRVASEVSTIGLGRADVVISLDDGIRIVTEVKREQSDGSRGAIGASFLSQALAYQAANVGFSQLLVLDLSDRSGTASESLPESIWVEHSRNDSGAIVGSVVVAVVRGNRKTPSKRS